MALVYLWFRLSVQDSVGPRPNNLIHDKSNLQPYASPLSPTTIMTSISASLAGALPKPKYTGEEEEIPQHAQQRGPRILGAGTLDDTQIVLKVSQASQLQSTKCANLE